jgi:transposase
MIVLGADAHKSSHTIAAVGASTAELLSDTTIGVGEHGFDQALAWARALGAERVWALEDCRHVSGSFERFLVARGERVVRVATRLMAGERRGGRERGKSDRIDALAVARAALREGVDRLPVAQLRASSRTSGCWSTIANVWFGCAPRSMLRRDLGDQV